MRSALAAVLAVPVLMTGCAIGPGSDPTAEPGVSIQGSVHGGQQPIAGAHVYLLAANTTGYGGSGIAASSSNASVSLLSASATGASDSIGAYVTSGSGGGFSISGDYSCTPDAQVYLYAVGGNSGAGTNAASGLMAALGNCPSTGNFAAATPYIAMNELTTIAAAYAFAGFATDATHVSSSGTALAKVGIKNAFANAGSLVNLSTGVARSTTVSGNGTVPQQLLNTLGNILAACINTNGSLTGPANATACYTLFNNAESGGSSGTVPSDTATAAINIAHNPGTNVSTLAGLPTAQAPFAPQLSAVPNDFTVGIEFTGGGLNDPYAVAIDASGNVWLADNGFNAAAVTEFSPLGAALSPSGGYVATGANGINGIALDLSGNAWLPGYYTHNVVELSSSGSVLSGTGGFTGGSLNSPYGIAVDGSGNVWASDRGTNSLVKLDSSGNVLSGTSGFTGNLKSPVQVALDPSGNAWVVNKDASTLAKFSNSGTLLSGANGYTGGGLALPYALALDHSGNVWIASYGTFSSNITEFSSSGSALSPSSGYTGGGLDSPSSIAVDGAGQVWVADTGTSLHGVSEFSNNGTAISPSGGYNGGNVYSPFALAVDGSGNVWAANTQSTTVTELIGVAAPVVTPIAYAVKNNALGTMP